jgi:hypothetical protein
MQRDWRVRLLAGVLCLLLTSSCLSVSSQQRPLDEPAGATGGIALKVFADDAALRAQSPGPRGLFIELERREAGDRYTPVFRSLEPSWSVMGLPAGEYRLRFPARLDEWGNAVALDQKPRRVKVHAGEVTEVETVLSHVNYGLIAAGVVTAVVAAVLLEDWLDTHDLPDPPLPPLPPPPVLDAVFWVTLDIATTPEIWMPAGPATAPVVTSHFPPSDALVAARRLRVTFALSEPLAVNRIASDAVTVLAEEAGLVPGSTSYDPEHWWIVWDADEELPRADLLHVTLAAESVNDLRGDEMEGPVSFQFRTTQ